jgi:transposase
VRPITDVERRVLEAGLRSRDTFVLRRCQILLGSARGEQAPRIAESVGCNDQTVRSVIRAFNVRGTDVLKRGSHTPKSIKVMFDEERGEGLKGLLHRSPREFGKDTSVWTLQLAAEVSFEQGLTPQQVCDETIRQAMKRLGIGWKRAKRWITSPDPEYARKKVSATG